MTKVGTKAEPVTEVHGRGQQEFYRRGANAVWRRIRQTSHYYSGTSKGDEEAYYYFGKEEFFRIPPPKLSQRPRGWVQERPCEIPPIQRKPDRAALHPPRSKHP